MATKAPKTTEFPPLDKVTGGRSPDLLHWLASRAEYNKKAGGLWRVHDGLYDLTEFVHRHPGGAEWLELTKGSDITEAFEAHHPDIEAARAILKKYYIRDADWPRESPLTFEKGGFYDTLRTRVLAHVNKLGPGPARWTKFYGDTLGIAFHGLLGVTAFVGPTILGPGNPWGVGVLGTAGLVVGSGIIGGMFNVIGHNFLHQKDSFRMYYSSLVGGVGSYRYVKIHHALSHHLYPNTSMDVELSMLEPNGLHFFPELPRRNPKELLKNIANHNLSLLSAGTMIFLFKPLLALSGEKIWQHWSDYLVWFSTLGMTAVRSYAISLVEGTPIREMDGPTLAWTAARAFAQVLPMHAIIQGINTWYWSNVGVNAGHHADFVWRQGDYTPPQMLDFGLHQLETCADRVELHDVGIAPVITTFGDHTMHHLFPTIDHAYHGYLYEDLAQTCKEFGIRFEFTTISDLNSAFYRMMCTPDRLQELRRTVWTGRGYGGWVDPKMGTYGPK